MTTKLGGWRMKRRWIREMREKACVYCGKRPAGTIDHLIPRSKGGRHIQENCVPACLVCNQAKGCSA